MVLGIFYLPKVVVNNDSKALPSAQTNEGSTKSSPLPDKTPHEELPPDVLQNIEYLKENLSSGNNIEKNVIFADSLAQLYLKYNKYDSAAKFLEIIAENIPNAENWRRAGEAYYEAFSYAMDADKRRELAGKAREYFEKILEKSPDNLDVKNKLAMTYLSTSNPMQGIMMLREILEQDPENEKAIFNLGALSIQSKQYEKAVERFSKLVELYPENTQARFFLAVSYLETGQKKDAKEQFEIVKKLDKDPQVQATVDSYLEEIDK